jgi:hypothetical protein
VNLTAIDAAQNQRPPPVGGGGGAAAKASAAMQPGRSVMLTALADASATKLVWRNGKG